MSAWHLKSCSHYAKRERKHRSKTKKGKKKHVATRDIEILRQNKRNKKKPAVIKVGDRNICLWSTLQNVLQRKPTIQVIVYNRLNADLFVDQFPFKTRNGWLMSVFMFSNTCSACVIESTCLFSRPVLSIAVVCFYINTCFHRKKISHVDAPMLC